MVVENSKKLARTGESWAQRWLLRAYMYLAFSANTWRDRFIEGLQILKTGLASETEQTKEMMQIYIRQSLGEATRAETRRANKQFRDLIRSMGLGFLIILPFAPVTLPLLVKLGRKLGIEILPNSFKDLFK